MSTLEITLPFTPRDWQMQLIEDPAKRIVCVVHRRAGKSTGLMWRGIKRALTIQRTHPPPRIIHTLPVQVQWARTGMWDELARAGSLIPNAQVFKSEMRLVLPNGAIYQAGGMDKPDSWRGGSADEVILDEYDDTHAEGQATAIEPMLADFAGVLVRSGTPKGYGRLKAAYERAGAQPGWSRYLLRYQDTGVLSAEAIADLRAEMTPEEFCQEMECSFETPNSGAYFAKQLQQAEDEGRIGAVPYDPKLPVWTGFDLGIDDSTAIWFVQISPGGEIRWIDYLENGGVGLETYAGELARRGYVYAKHILPHDVDLRELGTGVSRLDVLMKLGVRPVKIVPAMNPIERINALRMMLARSRFDAVKCRVGLKALWHYRREWNPAAEVFRPNPVHDWSSHGSDAAGHLAIGIEESPKATDTTVWFAPRPGGPTSWMAG
jgi:phage terminase large subunit